MGAEILLDYQWLDKGHWSSSIRSGYSCQYYRFTDFVDDGNDYSGNRLTGTSPHLFSLSSDLEYRSLSLQTRWRTVGSMPLRDDGTIDSDAFTVVDAYLQYRLQQGSWDIQLSTGVHNILDSHYASMFLINAGSFGGNAPRYYYPGAPRQWVGRLTCKYHW